MEKSCIDCRHFVPFYRKRMLEFVPVNFGYCINLSLRQNRKSRCSPNDICEKWEAREQNNERKEAIEDSIRKMEKQLEQIVLLLQNENEP